MSEIKSFLVVELGTNEEGVAQNITIDETTPEVQELMETGLTLDVAIGVVADQIKNGTITKYGNPAVLEEKVDLGTNE